MLFVNSPKGRLENQCCYNNIHHPFSPRLYFPLLFLSFLFLSFPFLSFPFLSFPFLSFPFLLFPSTLTLNYPFNFPHPYYDIRYTLPIEARKHDVHDDTVPILAPTHGMAVEFVCMVVISAALIYERRTSRRRWVY